MQADTNQYFEDSYKETVGKNQLTHPLVLGKIICFLFLEVGVPGSRASEVDTSNSSFIGSQAFKTLSSASASPLIDHILSDFPAFTIP